MSIYYSDFISIKSFAERLKADFPILLKPRDFADRITNMHNEHAHKVIDMAVEMAKLEFEKSANEEYQAYLKRGKK